MDRYPSRPRMPYTEMRVSDYLWWAFLVVFRLWFLCQLVTGIFALIYHWLRPDIRDFMFAGYIDLWNTYFRHLLPDWVDWMPMWYEPEARPAIAVLVILRILEFLRHFGITQNLAPDLTGRLTRPPEVSKRFHRRNAPGPRSYASDDFNFDAGRFRTDHATKDEPLVQLEDELAGDIRRYNAQSARTPSRDSKIRKAEEILRDPRTSRQVRETTLRMLEKWKSTTSE
jgi:hypothetical protein